MTPIEARDQFPYLETGRVYLNHAATSPWSKYVSRMVEHFRDGRMVGDIDIYMETMGLIGDVRAIAADMIGSTPDCLAFVQNTTEGLNVLATGLDWKQGDRIILFENEFPANVYPFLNLKRLGVEIDFMPQRDGRIDINDIERAITPRTRLVAVSWVQFLSGFVIDLAPLSSLCKSKGVLLSVDGIQGVGAIRLDLRKTPVDFLSAGVQKWQMGPQGVAIIHVAPALREQIAQAHLGWLSVNEPFEFFPFDIDLPDSSRRYENGSYNAVGMFAYKGALQLFQEVGFDVVEERVLALSEYVMRRVRERGYPLLTPEDRGAYAGIVSFTHPRAEQLCAALEARKTSISARCGALRIAPHFYNTTDEIDRLFEELQEMEG